MAHSTYPRLKINQNCSWNISCIITLVVEDVFAVAALGRKVFEVAISPDAVLLAELLPKLASN
jgi:hypothetical protein